MKIATPKRNWIVGLCWCALLGCTRQLPIVDDEAVLGSAGTAATSAPAKPTAKSGRDGWRIVQGAQVGAAKEPVGALRKTIQVKLTGSALFSAEGYATRSHADWKTVQVFIRVTNRDSALRCAIGHEDVVWRDAAGTALTVTPQLSSLFGPDDDCLQPGDSGYFLFKSDGPADDTVAFFDRLAAIEVAYKFRSTPESSAPAPVLVATQYAVDVTTDTIDITYANQSNTPVVLQVRSTQLFLLVDEAGLPLHMDSIKLPAGTYDPGATVTFQGSVDYGGSCQRILAFDLL